MFMITYHSENIGKSYNYKSNSHTNWVVPPHIHEYCEIAFTKQGETCVYIDKEKYIVPKNHLIFIGPNQIHEYSDETYSFMRCAVFSSDFVPIFHTTMEEKKFKNPVFDFSNHIWVLDELEKVDHSKPIKICGLLNIIADILLENGVVVSNSKNSPKHNSFQQIINFISSNFKKDIQLSDVARELCYHEKYLSSALHSLTGMNFRTFLALYRIDYSKKLLKNSSIKHMTISEIAMESGFSSINTFNRMFLKLTGVTPSQYKYNKQALN